MTKSELRASAYDAIIIGTGQAGPALARRLAGAGMTVAIVERALFGGTCVNTGCIPTKTLIASAYAIHMARRAGDFGVMVDGPRAGRYGPGQSQKSRDFRAVAGWSRTEPEDIGELHGLPRPRAVRLTARGASRRGFADRGLDLHQCRRSGGGAHMARHRSGRVSDEQLDDGGRFSAAPSGGRRRQLCRARIRPDVSTLRQRGDDRRDVVLG
jgi:choline dehydrogenase-like flavoprotein